MASFSVCYLYFNVSIVGLVDLISISYVCFSVVRAASEPNVYMQLRSSIYSIGVFSEEPTTHILAPLPCYRLWSNKGGLKDIGWSANPFHQSKSRGSQSTWEQGWVGSCVAHQAINTVAQSAIRPQELIVQSRRLQNRHFWNLRLYFRAFWRPKIHSKWTLNIISALQTVRKQLKYRF